jgi:hypothetical protein
VTTEAEQQAQARLAFGIGLEEQKTEQLEPPPGQLCLQEGRNVSPNEQEK